MMSAESGANDMNNRFKRVRTSSSVAFLFSVFLFHHSLDAAQTQIFSGPVSMAMGNGGRAGAEATEKVFLNPATVVLTDGFELGTSFRDGYWAKDEHETSFNLVLLENDPDNFAKGGLGYVQKSRSHQGLFWQERLVLGTMAQVFSPHFSMGISAYHLSQAVKTGPDREQWNATLGTLFTLTPNLGLAYVFSNVVRPDRDIPVPMQLIPQQSLALNVLFTRLARVNLDITRWERHNPDKKAIIQVGNEVRLGEYALLRVGAEIDDIQKRNSLTAGLGFLGPRLRANYAIIKPFKGTNGAIHSVDLRLPF